MIKECVESNSIDLLDKLKKSGRFKVWDTGKDRWLVEDYDNEIFFVLLYDGNHPDDKWWVYTGHVNKFGTAPVKDEDILQGKYSDGIMKILKTIGPI